LLFFFSSNPLRFFGCFERWAVGSFSVNGDISLFVFVFVLGEPRSFYGFFRVSASPPFLGAGFFFPFSFSSLSAALRTPVDAFPLCVPDFWQLSEFTVLFFFFDGSGPFLRVLIRFFSTPSVGFLGMFLLWGSFSDTSQESFSPRSFGGDPPFPYSPWFPSRRLSGYPSLQSFSPFYLGRSLARWSDLRTFVVFVFF